MKQKEGLFRIRNQYIFLSLMVSIYIVFFLMNPQFMEGVFSHFGSLLGRIIPIIGVIMVFMTAINYFLDRSDIKKYLGKESGVKGWLYTMLAGIFVPTPPYVAFPMLEDLRKKGMRPALIVAFLYNRNLQISFLPVIAYYFGIGYTIVVSVYIFVFSIIGGVLMERFLEKAD